MKKYLFVSVFLLLVGQAKSFTVHLDQEALGKLTGKPTYLTCNECGTCQKCDQYYENVRRFFLLNVSQKFSDQARIDSTRKTKGNGWEELQLKWEVVRAVTSLADPISPYRPDPEKFDRRQQRLSFPSPTTQGSQESFGSTSRSGSSCSLSSLVSPTQKSLDEVVGQRRLVRALATRGLCQGLLAHAQDNGPRITLTGQADDPVRVILKSFIATLHPEQLEFLPTEVVRAVFPKALAQILIRECFSVFPAHLLTDKLPQNLLLLAESRRIAKKRPFKASISPSQEIIVVPDSEDEDEEDGAIFSPSSSSAPRTPTAPVPFKKPRTRTAETNPKPKLSPTQRKVRQAGLANIGTLFDFGITRN